MKQGEVATFAFIEPMMALRVWDLSGWRLVYELKFDGYREVRLVSRNRTGFNNDYPQLIVPAARKAASTGSPPHWNRSPHSRRNERYLRTRAANIAIGIDALNNGIIGLPGCQPSDFVLCRRATGIKSHGIGTSGFGPNRQ